MIDTKFREELKRLLEQDQDKKIVSFVLDHAVSSYPTAFTFWLLRLQREYGDML